MAPAPAPASAPAARRRARCLARARPGRSRGPAWPRPAPRAAPQRARRTRARGPALRAGTPRRSARAPSARLRRARHAASFPTPPGPTRAGPPSPPMTIAPPGPQKWRGRAARTGATRAWAAADPDAPRSRRPTRDRSWPHVERSSYRAQDNAPFWGDMQKPVFGKNTLHMGEPSAASDLVGGRGAG